MQDEKMNKRKTGSLFEEKACEYLILNKVRIIERNFRCRIGEIDIIGLDGNTLVFFEVKYRKNTSYGHPVEAVTYKKQRTICKVANYYTAFKKPANNAGFRFDIISILDNEITWYKNAFPYHI